MKRLLVDRDIRDVLFERIENCRYSAHVTTENEGIVAGTAYAAAKMAEIEVTPDFLVQEGTVVRPGDLITSFSGFPKQIALAEERIFGHVSKLSGIATAARRAVELARGGTQIASGAWKKIPAPFQDAVRDAIRLGGALPRLLDEPFLYLDKNYVRMFGGIGEALDAARRLKDGHTIVIQLKGEQGGIRNETIDAVRGGADVIMVDTGSLYDASQAIAVLDELGVRLRIKIAFGKDVTLDAIPRCVDLGIDLLCIGKAIVDARLMDMKLDIVSIRMESRDGN